MCIDGQDDRPDILVEASCLAAIDEVNLRDRELGLDLVVDSLGCGCSCCHHVGIGTVGRRWLECVVDIRPTVHVKLVVVDGGDQSTSRHLVVAIVNRQRHMYVYETDEVLSC